jgi:hypothetical protein
MEKGSARLFQQATPDAFEQGWNIVELKTRKQIRQKVQSLLRLVNYGTATRSDMRRELLRCVATFGSDFSTQLVRSLQRDSHEERQSIVWLLTVLDARETIPPLQQMANDSHLPRAIRLSASLALAGMGVTAETIKQRQHVHLYMLS